MILTSTFLKYAECSHIVPFSSRVGSSLLGLKVKCMYLEKREGRRSFLRKSIKLSRLHTLSTVPRSLHSIIPICKPGVEPSLPRSDHGVHARSPIHRIMTPTNPGNIPTTPRFEAAQHQRQSCTKQGLQRDSLTVASHSASKYAPFILKAPITYFASLLPALKA